MNYSVFEVFRIGIGPSSSHTIGPMSAANSFLRELEANGIFGQVRRVRERSAGWRSSIARGWRSARWRGDDGAMRM